MRRIRHVVLIGVLAAATAVPVALALAATSTAPTVTTATATSVTDTGATLNGTVNPNAQQTQYAFQWGPTSGYGHETTLTSAGAGSTVSSVSATLSGLSSGSAYHFRIIAISSAGVAVGSDQTFTTTGTALAPSTPPTATTISATSVGQAGATLNGTVNPKGQDTKDYFEYGTTSDYGAETTPVDAGPGTSDVAATAGLTSLASSTTYHYRLVAVSPGGTTLGADQTLRTTTPPSVTTSAASAVGDSSAVLNGTVNPQGQDATYYFQYGTTTAYGLQSPPRDAGAGTGEVSVHAYLAGLIQSTTYHYRLVSQSAGGISYGTDQTLTTAGPSVVASKIALIGRMGFVSPGGVIGVEVGCFNGQTTCTGQITMIHDGSVVGQRGFSIPAESGGFQNLTLTSLGKQLLTANSRNHLLRVDVTVTSTTGQTISQALSLARWVWH